MSPVTPYTRARCIRLRAIITGIRAAPRFALVMSAAALLTLFGIFGLMYAIETNLGPTAVPAIFWGAALLLLLSGATAYGIQTARRQ